MGTVAQQCYDKTQSVTLQLPNSWLPAFKIFFETFFKIFFEIFKY